MCGVYAALCLPRSRVARIVASRPSTSPSASTSVQAFLISEGLAEKVVMCASQKVAQYATQSAPVNVRYIQNFSELQVVVLYYHSRLLGTVPAAGSGTKGLL